MGYPVLVIRVIWKSKYDLGNRYLLQRNMQKKPRNRKRKQVDRMGNLADLEAKLVQLNNLI